MGPGLNEVVGISVREGQRRHLLDVCASREGFVRPCKDNSADGFVGVEGGESGIEFSEERTGEGVQGFRAIQCYYYPSVCRGHSGHGAHVPRPTPGLGVDTMICSYEAEVDCMRQTAGIVHGANKLSCRASGLTDRSNDMFR